jgi:hypothetical protein
MKLKRDLTEGEIADMFPGFFTLQREVQAAGGECTVLVLLETEVAESDIKPSEDGGRCSRCKSKVVEVHWTGKQGDLPMEYHGAACLICKTILEYAGVSSGPVDLTEWFNKHIGGKE